MVLNYLVSELSKATFIQLGHTGENLATQLRIDATEWLDESPDGTLQLLVRDPNGNLYVAPSETVQGVLIWDIAEGDTIYAGAGEIELNLRSPDGVCIKSARCSTWLEASLSGDVGEQPEVVEDWVTKLLSAADEARGAAKKIDGMTVSAQAGTDAAATVSEKNGVKHIDFVLPKGPKGDTYELTEADKYQIAGMVEGAGITFATPEMYGAAGDGETDDTQAVQDAIDSGHNVLLTGRYKVGTLKLNPFVTLTGAPGGRIVDGKVCMCPHSSIVGATFEVTTNNANNCIVDIGTYDAAGVADSGGDDRYTIRDVKVVTNFAIKSGLDFVYIHAGDGELAHLFGIRVTNVSIDGRLGKVFHFRAFLNSGNIVDNGNGVWVNTVSIDNVWCGVPEYIVYIDYDDPDGLKAQLGTSLRIGEVFMHNVTGEYSAYAKNDVYIGFPSTISVKGVHFVDKGYTQEDRNADTAVYNIVQQPWHNSAKTIIRTDYLDEKFFIYAGLANQNIAYINNSYAVDESTLYDTFLHDLSNNAYGLISSRTTDVPVDPKNVTLNLVKNTDDSRTLMGAGLRHRMVFRSNAEDSGTKFSLYFRSRPAVEYNDHVGCLYSDLYMPYAVSKAQLGDAYVPVIGSMVFNTATGLPMWYTGSKWVYADGTESGFEHGDAVSWKSYTLPVASAETLGGVMPAAKTDEMTQSVGVDEAGGLWTVPGGSGGSTVDLDTTLTQSGKAADAKVVGDKLSKLNGANAAQNTEIAKKANDADLAKVAKSGSYSDLTGKPTIPTIPTTLPNPNKLILSGAVTAEYDGSAPVSVEIPAGGSGSYTLPIASATQLGGVMPAAKTDGMTQAVGVDDAGGLWTMAGGGSGEWIALFEKTLTEEDYNKTNSYNITQDVNGNPFSLHEIIAEVVIPSTTEYVSDGYGHLWCSEGMWGGPSLLWRTAGPSASTAFQRSVTYACTNGNTGYSIKLIASSDTQNATLSSTFVSSNIHEFTGFRIHTDYNTKYFPAGTIIRVYGR